MYWRYEKIDENGKMQFCPVNDCDGSITGKIVMNAKAWFDENPEEARKRGWIKHIYYDTHEEFKQDFPDYDPVAYYYVQTTVKIDDYTIKDSYKPIPKTEEMMALEEMLETMNLYVPSGLVQLDGHGGVLL